MKYQFIIFLLIIFLALYNVCNYNIKENISVRNKKIYILYTGGTIGMIESRKGYIPKRGYLESKLKEIMKDKEHLIGKYDIHEYHPLSDSANIKPKDWLKMANTIRNVYHKYDAFIIIHGTDTMAYTASALAYIFENLSKPVIITGSIVPLQKLQSDGRNNLINSLFIASHYNIPEVILCFDNYILRGCRSTKINANSVQALASPNYPLLGENGIHIRIDWQKVRKKSNAAFAVRQIDPNKKVILIKLFPGIDAKLLNNILSDKSIYGVILQTFGIGDAPTDKDLLNVIKAATKRGIVFINCTQCHMGHVDEKNYRTGVELTKAGAVSGVDMTAEAAIGKLYYLFSITSDSNIIKKQIGQNLRGELSESKILKKQI